MKSSQTLIPAYSRPRASDKPHALEEREADLATPSKEDVASSHHRAEQDVSYHTPIHRDTFGGGENTAQRKRGIKSNNSINCQSLAIEMFSLVQHLPGPPRCTAAVLRQKLPPDSHTRPSHA